ncbi:MAG: hypothetical protein IKQ64_07490 [Bacteroidales bacterium]|nr:hypothetical protein [Bacteroidales bacterium]
MKRIFTLAAVCLMAVLATACKGGSDKPKFEGIADIGKVSTPGVMQYDAANDVYTVSAAGLNLWNATDAASIVWMKVKGDFVITGDIDFVGEGVNPHRKIGFMIREDLSDNCAYADIAIHGDGLTSLQYRKARGENTLETGSVEGKAPTTIYLARTGNAITARSGKGSLPDYDEAAVDLNLPEECYVGLFVCSHEEDVVETAHFRNVRFNK